MDKILMIREVRDFTGCGLREAKEAVEEVQAGGGTLQLKEMVARATAKAANRPPRREEIKGTIRYRVRGLKNLVQELEETCKGDFGESDLPEIRGTLETLVNDALIVKDRLIPRLEDALFKEDSK